MYYETKEAANKILGKFSSEQFTCPICKNPIELHLVETPITKKYAIIGFCNKCTKRINLSQTKKTIIVDILSGKNNNCDTIDPMNSQTRVERF